MGPSMTIDTRIHNGLAAQFSARAAALEAGAESVGWKIGLNAPPVMEKLGTTAPVIGHLTTAGRLKAGESFALEGTTFAGVEPEIAIHLGADVPGEASSDDARDAIGALGCAIEIVDIDLPFDDLEAILAANVFHSAVLLGDRDIDRAGGDSAGVEAVVIKNGKQEVSAESIPGPRELGETVAHVATLIAGQGELLRAGEVIIAGALTAIVPVQPGDRIDVRFGALGELSIELG